MSWPVIAATSSQAAGGEFHAHPSNLTHILRVKGAGPQRSRPRGFIEFACIPAGATSAQRTSITPSRKDTGRTPFPSS